MLKLENFKEAKKRVDQVAINTKLIYSEAFSAECGNSVYIKPENLQKTGSFKLRGAYNKIMKLDEESKKKGLIASSAGNHAQGVAYAAKQIGVQATICMPAHTPLIKVEATRSHGANVVLHGDVYDEAYAKACELQKQEGYTFVHPFNDEDVIEGQGKLLLNSAGLPQGTSKAEKIGDQQATCLLGWTNNFRYKDFSLSFLIDGRFGGDIFSGTNRMLQASGVAACTVVNGERNNFVVDGVIADGKGGYVPSTIEVSPQDYWSAITSSSGNLGIGEANLYSATNVRLRNIALNYSFPRRMLENTCFQQVKLGLSCNNVWMIYSDMNGVDPESIFATSTNATGFENAASPTSRSFLFNVTLGF